MLRTTRRLLSLSLLLASPLVGQVPAGTLGFYRSPALHGETIVFAAEGDLWSVGIAGGVARRLTSHPAEETNPVISPDGRTLAFTARYEGPAELYTMPITGGMPTRRTFEAEASIATAWTPDGKLVYTTTHFARDSEVGNGTTGPDDWRADPDPAGWSIGGCVGCTRAAPSTSPGRGFHNNVTKPLHRRHGPRHLEVRLRRRRGG